MFGPKKQVLTALFPRMGQPHKPAEVVNGGVVVEAQANLPAQPANDPQAANDPQSEDAPAAATNQADNVTNLDLTRTRRISAG